MPPFPCTCSSWGTAASTSSASTSSASARCPARGLPQGARAPGRQQLQRPRGTHHVVLSGCEPGPPANGRPFPGRHMADSAGIDWGSSAFPSYLVNATDRSRPFPCQEPGVEVPSILEGGGVGTRVKWKREDAIWQQIRNEAAADAASEPLLSSFLYASILAHDSFEKALAFVLANRLADSTLLPTQLFEIFVNVMSSDDDMRCGALADVEAAMERDPACISMVQAILNCKGFQAIQTHRVSHSLWVRGKRVMALALQSRASEVFAVDIHPGARIGKGILLDHGTGVVIGETAVVGDNCSMLQNVTLGGTGKEIGDRHPKIGNNVLIGASATVLGNITVGDGSMIGAGSLVLKPVAPRTMVAGSPAKEVGKVEGVPAFTMQQDWEKCCQKLPSDAEASTDAAHHAAAAAKHSSPPPPPSPTQSSTPSALSTPSASDHHAPATQLQGAHEAQGQAAARAGSSEGEAADTPCSVVPEPGAEAGSNGSSGSLLQGSAQGAGAAAAPGSSAGEGAPSFKAPRLWDTVSSEGQGI